MEGMSTNAEGRRGGRGEGEVGEEGTGPWVRRRGEDKGIEGRRGKGRCRECGRGVSKRGG